MSVQVVRRMALAAGAAALLGMGMLTACAGKEKPAESSPPPSSTAPSLSATDKVITAGPHAGASAPPGAKARPAPTALPGTGG